jgi:DUF4097 and DUF4098 domain-containing protein YvlB
MITVKRFFFALLVLAAAAALWSQDASSDRTVVPFSDPGKPGLVKASLINGGITVKGYDGKEVIVEAKPRGHVLADSENDEDEVDEDSGDDEKENENKHAGMRRLNSSSASWSAEEDNNVIKIETSSWKASVDLIVHVPWSTSLKLHCVNGGNITVENVRGELEVENVNGGIILSHISGSAVAQTVNGDITVSFNKLDSARAMSMVTLNGDVDVTLPSDSKASLKMKIDNQGEIYSDFELAMKTTPQKAVEDKRSHGGRYRVTFENTITGNINGGGQTITLKTFNGDILLRKSK